MHMIMQDDALQSNLSSNISQRVQRKWAVIGSRTLVSLVKKGLGRESSESGPRSGSDAIDFLSNLGERKSHGIRL